MKGISKIKIAVILWRVFLMGLRGIEAVDGAGNAWEGNL